MSDKEFRAVLDWMMCSDPFPCPEWQETVVGWIERESQSRGFDGWIDAYHKAARP